MTKESREYQAEHRKRRLDQGLCVRCGEKPHRANRQSCTECFNKQRDEEKSRRAELARQGFCTNCGATAATDGHVTCEPCRLGLTANTAKYKKTAKGLAWCADYARKIRQGKRAAGLCVKCSRPSPDAYMCPVCAAAANERQKRFKARKKAEAQEQGLCQECFKHPHESGGFYCRPCLDRLRVRRYEKFGLTPELLQALGTACHLCGDDVADRANAIDHNHTTGAIRGLLCKGCNNGLGMFRDRPDLLRRAADYVESDGFHHIST